MLLCKMIYARCLISNNNIVEHGIMKLNDNFILQNLLHMTLCYKLSEKLFTVSYDVLL